MLRFGYASQNLTIPATTGRSLPLADLGNGDTVRRLVEQNVADLQTIVRWNCAHGIHLFRLNHQFIPFASHPAFPYDWRVEHRVELQRVGELAARLGVRLSIHPGQFIQPGSTKPDVREQSLVELRALTRLLDCLHAPNSVLILHLGGPADKKGETARTLVETLAGEDAVLQFLALENDEWVWRVQDVVEVARDLGIPVVVDTLHHALNPGALNLREALDVALPLWNRTRSKVHLASQDPAKQSGAHARDVIPEDLERLVAALDGRDADIMVEAKGKEQAVLRAQSLASALLG